MKVFQINSVCGVKSTGRIATDIYNILKQQGHECKIAYGRENPQNIASEDAIKIGTDTGVKFHALMSRITDKTGFYSKTATKKLIKQIEEYNPDVVHLHNIHGYYINIEMLFKYLAKADKKVVWTLHDCWSVTGHCAYFDIVNCDKWKTGCHCCPQKKKYPTSLVFDNSKSNWQKKKKLFTAVKDMTLITPSRWLEGIITESFLANCKTTVINNGIDLNVFKPTESDFRKKYNLEDKKIILGVAAIWEVRKGFEDFIKIAKMINDDYRIVMVGVTEEQKKQLPENVIAIGRTNNVQELAAIYTTSDVFINPTKEEMFGMVNIEALACGTPVVTYNTGGSPEGIDSSCGIVVDKGDVQALYATAVKVCEEKMFSEENCMAYAKNFDKNDKYNEYVDLYAQKVQ
ncbi:MAG: glycosyltransferase [Clostridia bacterium]|nr:glycosyltransferase [Clostridia bacterium]